MTKAQTRIVILGAGFGGLSVARLLSRSRIRGSVAITLVDKETESTYTPWLHEIAAGTVGVSAVHDADIPLESVRGVRFRRATVGGIDRASRHVLCSDGSTIPYDILVCAFGTISNDFDIPGVKAFAHDLKRTRDAIAIRARITEMMRKARQGKKQRLFVMGTGANGVEFAAECASAVRRLRLQSRFSVHLGGATSEVVPMLPHVLRSRVQRRLERLGVILHLSVTLTGMKEHMLTLRPVAGGIPQGAAHDEAFDACVVALGVKVPDVVYDLGFSLNERGRIFIDETLRVRGESAVFALGDSAVIEGKTPDPQTAQAAVRQAYHVAQNIQRLIRHQTLKTYRARRRWPMILTLGVHDAIASLGGVSMSGYTMAILRRVIDARYFFLATSVRETALRMGRGFLTYAKGDCTKDEDLDRE